METNDTGTYVKSASHTAAPRKPQSSILMPEEEGEPDYAIHSAEEARRAIIYAEVMNRKY